MGLDVLFCEIRGRRCALPARDVREVASATSLTPVPRCPPIVRGLTTLHGQVLPLIDLGIWFGSDRDALDPAVLPTVLREGARLVIVEARLGGEALPVRAALAVDRVTRLGAIDERGGGPPPRGPQFLTATVVDGDGPALLVDVPAALEAARRAVAAAGPA